MIIDVIDLKLNNLQLLIRGEKTDKFFDMLPDKNVMFHCYEGSKKTSNELSEITNEDIDISCKLKKEKNRLCKKHRAF